MFNRPVQRPGLAPAPSVQQSCRCHVRKDFQKNGRCPHCGGVVGVIGEALKSGEKTGSG